MEEFSLTKSKYLHGLQCSKLLQRELSSGLPAPDRATLLKFSQGNEVGEAARREFPGGTLIPRGPLHISIEKTEAAIASDTPAIFEGHFQHDNILILPDVLQRTSDSWNLIEVKASSSVKPVHIPDLAIQKYVLTGCGLTISRYFVMHLNSKYTLGGNEKLFFLDDVTSKVDEELLSVPSNLETIRTSSLEPGIGPHCSTPYDCPLKSECWKDIPPLSVFNIPGLYAKKKWPLHEAGVITLDSLPLDFPLNDKQKRFMQSVQSGEPVVDVFEIRKELDSLEYPLYFMDFETMNWAVPRYVGCKPYQHVGFQWSVHVLNSDASLEHFEFLFDSAGDPRPAFVESLMSVMGEVGSVVVYNAPFEKMILTGLKEAFLSYAGRIDNVLERIWDQLVIFRKYYTDGRFLGSNSIKSVLPVVTELSYSDLDGVCDGTDAQVAWVELVGSEEKERLRRGLLEYCKLDTLAMVEIHRILEQL